jgi:polar amino acid transport system substrate-binding protein
LLSACTPEQTTWDRVQTSGVLRVGLDPTYPPFEFTDGTSLQGIDVDLAETLVADLDLEVSFSHFGFDGLYDALATEQVDVLISALVPDVARTRDFAYSAGYINSGLVLVSRPDAPLTEISELVDKTIGVELGTAGHVEATNWQRQVPNLYISVHQSSDEALSALASGQIDVAAVDNITARLFVGQRPESELAIFPVGEEPYAMVVRLEDRRLLTELDSSLSRLSSSGQLDSILNSWLQG